MTTNKIKRVLIALDYDPTAQKVAEVGYSLADSMGAEVILLHVISDPTYYSSIEYSPIMGFTGYMDVPAMPTNLSEGLMKASQHFLDKSKQHLGGKNIATLVLEGNLAESILSASKKMKADIIVMGSHSRKWLENIVMGSVTESVLHQTMVPLYIVPTKKSK